MSNKKTLPPTYFGIFIIFLAFVHFVFPVYQVFEFPSNLIGILLLCVGLAINLIADKQFRDLKTTVYPFRESSTLVVKGLYKFSRNPMYFGMLLILYGEAILFGSIGPMIFATTFILLMNEKFIKVEEKMLLEKFRSNYFIYKNSVRRWI